LHLQRTVGNRATRAFLQRQEEEQGSATVVGSTAPEELAIDDKSFTAGIVAEGEQGTDPAAAAAARTGRAHFESQHPSLAQIGIPPAEIKGRKVGVFIGNSRYQHTPPWDPLAGAKRDAENMKAVMGEHGYKTASLFKDKTGIGLEAVFQTATKWVQSGDALLLYYAGHGLPEGLIGVNSNFKEDAENTAGSGGGAARGFKRQEDAAEMEAGEAPDFPELTAVFPYTKVLSTLEKNVAKGVHTTLIVDACHSGAAAELVRERAIAKLGKDGGRNLQAIETEIKRLEDMKRQAASGGGSAAANNRGLRLVSDDGAATDGDNGARIWRDVVRPELLEVAAYLSAADMEITVPETLSDYSAAGISQQINSVINKLIDLAEALRREGEAGALSIAP
jgi:hypothetical protein